jgi:hypothetical protein
VTSLRVPNWRTSRTRYILPAPEACVLDGGRMPGAIASRPRSAAPCIRRLTAVRSPWAPASRSLRGFQQFLAENWLWQDRRQILKKSGRNGEPRKEAGFIPANGAGSGAHCRSALRRAERNLSCMAGFSSSPSETAFALARARSRNTMISASATWCAGVVDPRNGALTGEPSGVSLSNFGGTRAKRSLGGGRRGCTSVRWPAPGPLRSRHPSSIGAL